MFEEKYNLKFIKGLEDELMTLINSYDFIAHQMEIFKTADQMKVHIEFYKKSNGQLLNLFELLFILKVCNNIKIEGISTLSDDIQSIQKAQSIKVSLLGDKLKQTIIESLEAKINNEIKDFYYNNYVIKQEQTEREIKVDKLHRSLFLQYKLGKISQEELIFKSEKLDLENPDPIPYNDFFSIKNLSKLIMFSKEEYLNSPKNTRQVVGMHADKLMSQLTFGYKTLYQDFIEAPDIEKDNSSKEIWEKYESDIKKQEEEWLVYQRDKYLTISQYKRYAFIYDLLTLLEAINDENCISKKEKFQYIRDSIRAYHKFKKKS